MFSIVWKLIILYLCESNIEFYMRVKRNSYTAFDRLSGQWKNDISEPYSF